MPRVDSRSILTALGILLACFSLPQPAQACTRAVYLGPSGTVITARSMDWAFDIKSNLWIFPRGMERDGAAGPQSVKWVSQYGSVVATGYDVGTADGMNEKGLVASALYLTESEYGAPSGEDKTLSIAAWAQYALDNYATVAEAVKALAQNPFVIIAPTLPDNQASTLHLAMSDPSGDSAIFEYIGGKLVIHHDRKYQVMTNSPSFDQQLALNAYWQGIGGLVFLPGTNRAADRFARASFLIKAIPQTADITAALASVFGVIRGVSVPLGISTPGEPNISSTRWRSIADQKNLVYYFDMATSPMVFWVELDHIDFAKGAAVKKLELTGGQIYSGDAAAKFTPAQAFPFLPATAK